MWSTFSLLFSHQFPLDEGDFIMSFSADFTQGRVQRRIVLLLLAWSLFVAFPRMAAGYEEIQSLSAAPVATRPVSWAIPLQKPGLRNFFKVSETLYRGGQPESIGFTELAGLGIKTVVNLEIFHSDRDRLLQSGASLDYVHIPMQSWHAEDEVTIRFLQVVSDPKKSPVFVHCYHGSDRTGTMVAVYRMVIQGWSKEEALQEMTKGGFGFHAIWTNLEHYLIDLDLERLKSQAGLSGGVPTPTVIP
jgi:protein tyrosine phosphatase (PTP) superfamily phosphohydrolase (DUF442 family)